MDVTEKDIKNVDFALLKKDTTIKGIVKLPEGRIAPREGITVSITAENDALDFVSEKTVVISAGNSAVEYEIEVPSIDNYQIKYTIKSMGGYVTSGYYSEEGTVGRKECSTPINCSFGSLTGINLNLIPGMEIRGKVSLPPGQEVNRKDFWMWVVASNENYESTAYVTIPEGSSGATYSVYVPEGDDYVVSYSLLPLYGEYIEKGYYNSSATTANKNCATKLNVAKNNSGIDLALIPVDRIISGRVSLPDGTAAIPYSIRVPSNNRGNGYRVGYSVTSGNTNGLYYENGYFSRFGTTSDINDASIIDVSTRNSSDRDMTLITDDIKPVEAIMLDKYQVTLQSGGTVKLKVKHLPEDATNKTIKWSTGNTNIAEVSSEGVVKAKAAGTTVITATSNNSVMTAFTVKVVPAEEEGLGIDKLSISLNPGERKQLHAIFNPKVEDNSVVWASDNTEVADVTEDGLVTAVKSGFAVITATSTKDSSVVAECSITVITPVNSVEIDRTELKIKVGYKEQLTARALPNAASYKGISWTSSNERVVKVSQSGEVTGVGIGTAVVTASSIYNPSVKVECEVTVVPVPVEKIILDRESVSLYPEDYILITADILPLDATDKRVEWKSKDNSIATVTSDGLVKAVDFGETEIIATSLYGASIKAECVIKVIPRPVTKVAFKTAVETISINTSKILEATVLPTNATNKTLIWTSSNEDIATVSKDGLVTGKKAGTVEITAAWEDDPRVKTVCTVTIEAIKVLGVSLNIRNTTLNAGERIRLVAKITPENATNKEIVWTSSNNQIAKVSSTGMVTAVSAGTVTITAASKEDQRIKNVCTITVREIVVSDISLSRNSVTLAVGETITLDANIYPSNAHNKDLDWKSSNSSVAQVSSGGVVKAKTVGTAIITVTSKANSSCKDTCTIYVEEALPTPTEPVYDPGVIPGAGGGDVPIVSIDETPSPSATPTPTPSGTSSPAVTQTPTQGNDKPGSLDSFIDIKGHWAADFFEDLLQKGIVSGYPDKTLRPNAPITRAEAAVMVMKAAGFEISKNTVLTCTDKDTVPDWAKAYVATAMYKGVVKGYEDASFRPSNRLTRQETVVLVLRAFEIEEAKDKTLSFADSNTIPAWSAGYRKKTVELGIIKGYSDNTFGSQREITRAEVATIISKCMQLKK